MDYENQKMLEHMFNKRQQLPMYKQYFIDKGINVDDAVIVLAQIAIHRVANVQTMIGLLRGHCKGDLNRASSILQQCVDAKLIGYDSATDRFTCIHDVSQKVKDIAAQYKYLPPMIVPPQKLTDNKSSGYLTKGSESLILNDNHHDEDICLDSLNRFNAIPLKINPDVVKNVRNCWKHMDKQKSDETFEEFMKRVKAFENYEKNSFWIIALMLEMGNQFWLEHKVDKRGRTYAQGYHINTQGNTWNKSCIEFFNEEIVELE